MSSITDSDPPRQRSSTLFWERLQQDLDPTGYRPHRRHNIVVARLESGGNPFYVLKQPKTRSYLRLSEADYALWWQMDGQRSLKDLLFYSLVRYQSLPIGHLNGLVADLRAGHFLQDQPTGLYRQIEQVLAARAPSSRGRRLLNRLLYSEHSWDGLDSFFTALYRRVEIVFTGPFQLALLLFILAGSALFVQLVQQQVFSVTAAGIISLASLVAANLVVIGIHELAHALTAKNFGREVNRGGILLYWAMPAFFVDTRDTWLSPKTARMAVSWAGPYSGLLVGSLSGFALTAVFLADLHLSDNPWLVLGLSFLYQIGFLAYLSAFINLNPLLELDGYFILMDGLEMPGLRQRAFRFWRESLWPRLRAESNPVLFWRQLSRTEQIFAVFGGLALVYSAVALYLAGYFWQTRLSILVGYLWGRIPWGRLLVLLLTVVVVVPGIYWLLYYGWSRIRAGLDWLAHRNLLARPDMLALLIGLPLLLGLPALRLVAAQLGAGSSIFWEIVVWLLHLAAVAMLAGVAYQLAGSRFQWTIWSLSAVPVGLAVAWFGHEGGLTAVGEFGLLLSATAVMAAGSLAWSTVRPRYLVAADRLMLAFFSLLALVYGGLAYIQADNIDSLTAILILSTVFLGLLGLAPVLVNFRRSRFALPWLLIVASILTLPWLHFLPDLHPLVALLWLYAGSLYLLLGSLAQFARFDLEPAETAAFGERAQLVSSYNHFIQALFTSYEAVFGGRRLAEIEAQMRALGPVDADLDILSIAASCRNALLLAVDRLDDLAGTPFTRQAGQAAYDSLPWPEAETLGRHVLAETEWGSGLAQGFIRARDRRVELIRNADIFAGFDQDGVAEVLRIAHPWRERKGQVLGAQGAPARRFFLLESGAVGVFQDGVQTARLTAGGYFGTPALLATGDYEATYRALTPVTALMIQRQEFDPLLRADTTLASQVTAGADERQLLRHMPLFSSLSPQQLAMVDARLGSRQVDAGEVIVRQGEPRSSLFIVASGTVAVVHEQSDGAETPVGNLGPGEHFGEYALFADTPYAATYRAQSEGRLLLLDEPTFDRLVAEHEQMSHYVEQVGSARLMVHRRRPGPTALL